ncbi:MAG: aroB [Chlamydiales bacterium]|jgi:3-dehydroquinate synthase|nr:aroB [Chlamydiales bacterium]
MEPKHSIIIGLKQLLHLGLHLNQQKLMYSRATIITNFTLALLYGELIIQQLKNIGLPAEIVCIEDGESQKNLHNADRCWQKMHEAKCDRKSLVIGFGGGVISDLAGFVANCYMRGIDLILIPTTLMGMVDAAIGGKNGINTPTGKNIIGSVLLPKLLLIDPTCLSTLPTEELTNGLAEVVKYGVIADATLLELLEEKIEDIRNRDLICIEEIIRRCCDIKQKIVLEDLHDINNRRAVLNWGHTFGHAIEKLTSYRVFKHGEAVSIGMSCAAHLSYHLELCDRSLIERQDNLLKLIGLPTKLPSEITIDQIIEAMAYDKKAVQDQIVCIISEGIGQVCYPLPISRDTIRKALLAKQELDYGALIKARP